MSVSRRFDSRDGRARRTHCFRGHELTPKNTYVDPSGERSCRTCNKTRKDRYQRPRVEITCPVCHEKRLVQRTNRPPRVHGDTCQRCAAKIVNESRLHENKRVEPTEDLRQWWLERFTPAEIQVLANQFDFAAQDVAA
jgi:hypothetical protein